MSSVKIEIYDDRYHQQVVDLILEIQMVEFGLAVSMDTQPDLLNIPASYQLDIGNFWVALVNDELAGTIALFDIGDHDLALRKMFVKAAYRGKLYGVGQQLLNTAVAWAREKKIRHIFLGTTEQFLAAQRFYEKNGFEEIEKATLPEAFPVMPVDVKFYQYTIST